MIKTKTKSRTAQPLLSTWYFRASGFIRGTGLRNLWLVFGLLIVGMTITTIASLYVKSEVERAAEQEFDFINSEIQHNVADRLAASAQVLYSGAALFDSSETVTREEWRIFIEQLRIEEQLPGTQGVGFALLIPPDQLEQHIQQIQDEGFPEYAVRPEGDREIYSSIIYLEPFSGRNLRAFGYDMFSEPVRRAAMEQARDENTAVLSGKVVLVQETNEDVQAGTLMYVPVYRNGMPIETVEQRRAAIIGWVYSPYRMTDLMRGTLRNWEAKQGNQHTHLQVYDGDVISADTLLFDSRSEADQASAASPSEFSKLTPVDFNGRHWTLRFSQMGGLSTLANYDSVWFMLSGGTCFTIFLAGLVLSLLRTQVKARRIAEELTIELKESEEKYSIVFKNEVYAICIFDLETLELLEVNEAYERVYGYSRDELLSGMTIHNITAEHQASDAATVKAAREGTTFIPLRYHRKKDGSVFPVEIVEGSYVWRSRKVMFTLTHDITERKKDEQEIRKLGRAIEQNPASIIITDTDGDIEYVNPKFTEITGYTFAEASGRNPRILKSGHTTEQEYRLLWDAIESGNQWQGEFQNMKKNGELYWEKATITPVWNDLGQITNFLAIKEDITKRKQAEDVIQKLNQQLNSVLDGTRDVIAMLDREFRYTLFNSAFHEEFKKIFGKDLKPGDSMPEALAGLSDDLGEAMKYWERALDGEDFTVLQQFGDSRLERNWYELHFSPIRDDAGKVSGAVHIIRNINERKLIEEALTESEERFRTMFANHSAVMLLVEPATGIILDANLAAEKFYGYSVASLRMMNISDINALPPEEVRLERQRALNTEFNYFIFPHRMANGNIRTVEVYSTPLVVKGKPILFSIIHDITERKQMEIDLKGQRDFATQIVNLMGQGLTVTDADGRFEFVNPAYARLFGYAPADLIGKRPADITLPDDDSILAEQRRLRQNGQSSTYESRLIRADGSIAHVLISAVPRSLNPVEKFYGAITVITDLTEQKLIDNKLRASEEKYRTVANFTYDWEAWRAPDGAYLYNSPSCERISGHSVAEFNINPNLMLEIAHPDDQPSLKEHQRAAGQELKDQDLEIDFRIITPDGDTHWIAHSCTSVYSESGQWLGRREGNRDITDRKKSEEEIRLLNAELEQLAGTDGLTGINNHRSLIKLAEREFEVAMRYQPPLSMLFFDIDHFKLVNDTFGHAVGDEALKLTIQTVCAKLRSADLIGRYGGDEFVILLPQTSAQDALPLAERIHASIADMRIDTDKGLLPLTISIGIAQSIHDASEPDTVESLLLRADQALYTAKQGGRNRTVIFDEKSS